MLNKVRGLIAIILLFSGLIELTLYSFWLSLNIFNNGFLTSIGFRIYFLILALISFFLFIILYKKSSLKIKNFVNTFLKSFLILIIAYFVGEFIFYYVHKAFLGELIISSLLSVFMFLVYSLMYASCGFLHRFSNKYHYLFNLVLAIFLILFSIINFKYLEGTPNL